QHEGGRVRVLRHLLDGDGQPEDAGARPPVLLRSEEAEQTRVAEDLEQVLRVLAGVVDLTRPGPYLVLCEAAHGLLERGQLLGQLEHHGREATGTVKLQGRRKMATSPLAEARCRESGKPSGRLAALSDDAPAFLLGRAAPDAVA